MPEPEYPIDPRPPSSVWLGVDYAGIQAIPDGMAVDDAMLHRLGVERRQPAVVVYIPVSPSGMESHVFRPEGDGAARLWRKQVFHLDTPDEALL